MLRGEVWWARLPSPLKNRPVLLLMRDSAYPLRTSATVAPVTSRIRGLATEVMIGSAEGVQPRSVINVDDIRTIPIAALERRVGMLTPEAMEAVEDAIQYALSLPEYSRQRG